MKFGDLFSKSWKEYKESFGLFFKIFLVFSLIPSIVFTIIGIFFPVSKNLSSINILSLVPFFGIVSLISITLYFIMSLSYLYISFFKQENVPMNFGKAVKGGLGYFWKYVGLSLLMFFLLGLLVLPSVTPYIIMFFFKSPLIFLPMFILSCLLLIPFLIFLVYWTFSAYVLMREHIGAWKSMKRSKRIIKGRWWKVFGYGLLLGIIIMLISIPFSIPESIFKIFTSFFMMGEVNYSSPGIIVLSLFVGVVRSFATLITIPLSILFFKNFYIDLRTNLLQKQNN